ncbi:hypothetical protein [Microcystis sp. LE19-195.1E]|uniref:hypothetical protein n=1 Tax=Microcystis sp. LE19-195.1E TaxID=3016440 RepID=UPI0025860B7B|nr:hypothetical protein [Microcystis sp. LE19-195.1E]
MKKFLGGVRILRVRSLFLFIYSPHTLHPTPHTPLPHFPTSPLPHTPLPHFPTSHFPTSHTPLKNIYA